MKIEPGAVLTSEPSMRSLSARSPSVPGQAASDVEQIQERLSKGSGPEETKVNPEEILDRIREISQDGLYSVRFEKNEEINELIVKVVDQKTDEVIRQLPPEALLGVKSHLAQYLGNLVNKYT